MNVWSPRALSQGQVATVLNLVQSFFPRPSSVWKSFAGKGVRIRRASVGATRRE